jgi:hypothetical protein
MLSDISESFGAMPDSLYAKVEKFYAVNPSRQVSAQQITELFFDTLEWLDDLWEQGELQDYLTEEEYLDFLESIKESF